MISLDILNQTKKIFSPAGILARKLADYESRPGQLAMAEAVASILQESESRDDISDMGRTLAVEAETGIGKTLAYLVPAALSRQKIIVSTGTLNLQDQILNKEIPFIRKYIDPELSALCVKGRQNYLCLYRWKQVFSSSRPSLFNTGRELDEMRDWLRESRTGDRAELHWLEDNSPLWREVSATSSQCLGGNCPEGEACFLNRLRKKAARSRLLIVNHHLFFSDLALRRFGFAEVLPRYESVIFDEAHHLENVATRYFGSSFSHYQVIDLVKDLDKRAADLIPSKKIDKTVQLARSLASQADHFVKIFPGEMGRFPLAEMLEKTPGWKNEIEDLKERIIALGRQLEVMAHADEIWNVFIRRCDELLTNLRATAEEGSSSYVYWFERRQKTVALSASPIEIATDLQESLYPQVKSVVFTSATLTTGSKFTYLFDRLGLDSRTETLTLPTPFDYKKRTLLYIPENRFPLPASPAFFGAVQERTAAILRLSKGRALLLFTSIRAMEQMRDFLEDQFSYPLLVQGNAPRAVLLEKFQRDTHSVLLAVASFWEGVNVPGETLSCVIIDKLPFEVPSDPVIMARMNKIKEEGGNPFFDFQIPRAILSLRQGVGRLMRCATDQGLLAIMDVRLFAKPYGRLFLKSLPESPIVRDLDDVTHFFNMEGKRSQAPHLRPNRASNIGPL